MHSPWQRSVTLERHRESSRTPLRSIVASVWGNGQVLSVSFVLEGSVAGILVPAPKPPAFAEGLWQHTCCELFVAHPASSGYHEFNFSPSGEWAAYAFARYRDGRSSAAGALERGIAVRTTADKLELDASIRLDRLAPDQSKVSLGLSAVIEDREGTLSYWALAHPPGAPDFHHRLAFALEVP